MLALPGGYMEIGESLDHCAARTVLVSQLRLLYSTTCARALPVSIHYTQEGNRASYLHSILCMCYKQRTRERGQTFGNYFLAGSCDIQHSKNEWWLASHIYMLTQYSSLITHP